MAGPTVATATAQPDLESAAQPLLEPAGAAAPRDWFRKRATQVRVCCVRLACFPRRSPGAPWASHIHSSTP